VEFVTAHFCATSSSFHTVLLIASTFSHFRGMVDYPSQGPPNFLSKDHISCCTTVQGPDILRNGIVSEYVTFYQIKIFPKFIFFIIDKMSSRVGFGPRAV